MESPIVPVVVKQAIFWLSYLVFPAIGVLVFQLRHGRRFRLLCGAAILPLLLFVYARFIEPKMLKTSSHDIKLCGDGLSGTLKVAVASDFHIGIFPNAVSIDRVVREVNRAEADLLLMPGDFTYYLSPDKFVDVFEAFAYLQMPAYAVMGNHDEGIPGPSLSEPLEVALEDVGVNVLNPKIAEVRIDGKYIRIVGTRDYWRTNFDGSSPGETPNKLDMATILLQHNPDFIKDGKAGNFDLMVAGHTHGGQINLPWLTCALTLACNTLRYGYEDTPVGKLFVTSGTGMVGLPLRFRAPPKVDYLNITISRCRAQYGPKNPMMPKPQQPTIDKDKKPKWPSRRSKAVDQ